MLNRQKIALRMLCSCGGTLSRIRLTKLLFLLGQESPSSGGAAFYQFVPYMYGPYSFSLSHEMDHLVRNGLVELVDEYSWGLTKAGMQEGLILSAKLERDIATILSRYGHLTQAALVDRVYKHYPWYTVASAMDERRRMEQPVANPAVYTMGYEGLLIDGFMDNVLRAGIQRIIDVRSNPVSRRYGFHQGTLARIAQRLGLGYQHFPELGIPAVHRVGLHRPEADQVLLETYAREMLPCQFDALSRLAWSLQEMAGVLVCIEADPARCHRSLLAEAVAPLAGLSVVHLGREQ